MQKLNILLISIFLSSCQLPMIMQADKYVEPEPIQFIQVIDEYETVWDRISASSSIQDEGIDEETLKYINSYLANPSQFIRLIEKGRYFIFYVLEELDKYRLPPELALLPYIESNYDPFSISPSGAMGLWQFMPATARIYGLEDTWWYEERHDPLVSSKAAVRYLAYLHNRFNKNINYTLAAYNGGPTLLEKRIKQNKKIGLSTYFNQLKLPMQTLQYVPKFKAITELIVNAEKYGIELPEFPDKQVLGVVELDGQIEIMTFSEFANLKPEFVYKLNAGYTKWASPPGEKTTFNIPIELKQNLDLRKNEFVKSNQINWVTHKVSRGDSLWNIARKFEIDVDILKKVNYLASSTLSINQELLIPLSNQNNESFIPYQAHIVSEGDTLWSLGLKYKISPTEIARNNGLKENSILKIGSELNIGNKNIYRTINSKKRTILYSVKQGDSLYRIADIFNIEINDIIEINEISNNEISPGQVLKIIIGAF